MNRSLKSQLIFFCLFFLHSYTINSATLEYDKAATFLDTDRAEKVAATQEVVAGLYQSYVNDTHAPGFVYGVVLDGKIVYSGQIGHSNIELDIKANAKSLFRIASMSKSFTAIAILQLRDAGKLNLDDPVSKYITEMADINYLTADSPPITVRHLMTHGAGFPSDDPWGDRQLAISNNQLLKMLGEGLAFSSASGSEWEYSNLGFAILGVVIEKISGKTFEEYTTTKILEPLGMHDTVWEFEKANTRNLALGYDWVDEQHVKIPLEHHGAFGPMGGLITSIEDFTKYVALHLAAWPPRDDPEPTVLKRSSLREMHQPKRWTAFFKTGNCPTAVAYTYGLVWAEECNADPHLSHSGGLPGFGSHWVFSPQYGLAVFAFDNVTYASPSGRDRQVFKHIINEAGLTAYNNPPSTILKRRKEELYQLLINPDNLGESKIFAENFYLDNRENDVVKEISTLMQEIGKVLHVDQLVPDNQLRGNFIIEGERKKLNVFFALSPEKNPLIQDIKLKIIDEND